MSKAEHSVTIVDESRTFITRPRDPSEQWSGEDSQTIHSIKGFKVNTRKSEYRDITLSFKPENDKSYFLLYVLYWTGNSFGHSKGNIEYIGMYRDEEVARENQRRIRSHYDRTKEHEGEENRYQVKIITEGGTEFIHQCSWVGYFERLEDVDIQLVRRIR